jgi:PAS domain S-box-containing protein
MLAQKVPKTSLVESVPELQERQAEEGGGRLCRDGKKPSPRESGLYFRNILDNLPGLISAHDPEDNVIYYNKAAIAFLGGRDLQGVLGISWQALLHPDDREGFLNRRAVALRQHLPYQDECRIKDSSGQYRWMLISAAPQFIDQEFQGYVTSNTDITKRKEMESALEESETRFRNMAEITPIHICVRDASDKTTYLNKASRDFLGMELPQAGEAEDWFPPDNFWVHPDDLDETLRRRDKGWETHSAFTTECRVKNGRGEYRWLLMASVPRFAGGVFQGYINFGTDVTPLKEAEVAVRESGQRFKLVADTVPAMIYLHDKDERIEFANRGLLDYAGLKPEDVVGVQVGSETWSHFIHPEDISRFWDDYQDKVRRRAPYQYELRIRSWDGTYQWTTLSGVPRYDQMGRFAGYTGVYADISKLKESERQNNELREGLEKKVIERTAELEAVNKELESFSYSISHDLRAPLRGIDGMSLAVLEDYRDRLDDRGRKYLEILRKEAQHMGELINEMLNLSRLTRGTLHWDSVNLSETALEIAGNLKWQEPNRQVTFKITPDVVVQGDAHLLRAVLENLLGNAWKFTSGHPTATIEFGVEEQEGQTVYFVKDDGAGFDMAYANKLFNAFQRLHTASEFPGSGIGLATVQRIIHRHGGRAWARGEIEKGAQMFFTLGKAHEHIAEH